MKRFLVVFTVLGLVLTILLTACGGGGGKEPTTLSPTATHTATYTATTTVTATPTATPPDTATITPTPTSLEPVKIGAIYARSGPMAMVAMLEDPIVSLVEWQVKNQGGILGGREVKFIKGDDAGVVAQAAAQAIKLITEDKVAILTFGGESVASFDAVAAVAEEYKVPYVSLSIVSDVAAKKYCAALTGWDASIGTCVPHLAFLKPKTIAVLAYDLSDIRYLLDGIEGYKGLRERVNDIGIDIVYEQYFPLSTVDFSPYMTKIKYLNPDLLLAFPNDAGQQLAMQKQIMELGGYGNMKFYSGTVAGSGAAVTRNKASWGSYTLMQWMAGSSDPGMKAFEDAYVQKYGKLPDPQTGNAYNCFWAAIKAIELAGIDNPEKVAQALRSGNLKWDSAFGPMSIDSNGNGTMNWMLAQIQEGKLVKVWPE